jgi:hypothetical protein
MSIAAALRESAVTWLIGEGPGFMLARDSPFDEHIRAETMTSSPTMALRDAVRESDLIITVMNGNAVEAAAEFGKPCIYVDTLLWMWSRPPHLPAPVSHYFAEGFRGAEQNLERWRDRLWHPEVVPPLIAPAKPVDPSSQSDVLFNFGGLSSWLVPQEVLVIYARTMIECAAEALCDWPGNIIVCVGQHILDALPPNHHRQLARDGVVFADLGNAQYLRHLERSRLLISSPGLHATEEALLRGIPCLFLPSQNLSQAVALQTLDQAGAAFALDWNRIYDPILLDATDELGSCLRIADRIRRFETDVDARARLVVHIRGNLGEGRLKQIAASQAGFLQLNQSLPGPDRIAAYVRELLMPGSPRPPSPS